MSWIKCSERMPEVGQSAIMVGYLYDKPASGYWTQIAHFEDCGWMFLDLDSDAGTETDKLWEGYDPVFWLPIPPLPPPPSDGER